MAHRPFIISGGPSGGGHLPFICVYLRASAAYYSLLRGLRSPQFVILDVTHNANVQSWMIVGYRDKRTRDFAGGKRVKASSGIDRAARLKLDRLESAMTLRDLAALPGNRLEALAGDRQGQHSIRINDQWRICFEWPEGAAGPSDVQIVDYH